MTEPFATTGSEFTCNETAATLATMLGMPASEVSSYLIVVEHPDGSLSAQTNLVPAAKCSALMALKWAAEVVGR